MFESRNLSVVIHNFMSNNMFRVLPFLKIFIKKFKIDLIGGYPKTFSNSAMHLEDFIFKEIEIKLFKLYFSKKDALKKYQFSVIAKNLPLSLRNLKMISGDSIICYKMHPINFVPSLYKKLMRGKNLIIDLDDHLHGFSKYVRYLRRTANLLICGSKELQKLYGGVYIPTPVDTDFFNKNNFDIQEIKERYNLSDSKIILYMGTFKPHKGIKEIFNIFSSVLEENRNVKLLMVGGNEIPKINKIYIDYGKKKCGDKVIFTGFRPHSEMPLFLSAADVFLTPVRDNNVIKYQTPAKIAEALSMELPVICSAAGEYKNLINNGLDGFLISPNDFKSFEDKLIFLIENEDERKRFGVQARKSCLNKYSFKVIEELIFQIFRKYSIL